VSYPEDPSVKRSCGLWLGPACKGQVHPLRISLYVIQQSLCVWLPPCILLSAIVIGLETLPSR